MTKGSAYRKHLDIFFVATNQESSFELLQQRKIGTK